MGFSYYIKVGGILNLFKSPSGSHRSKNGWVIYSLTYD